MSVESFNQPQPAKEGGSEEKTIEELTVEELKRLIKDGQAKMQRNQETADLFTLSALKGPSLEAYEAEKKRVEELEAELRGRTSD